ncbi:hypothetical protein [Nocardioides dongkuii]|uniref:hypothetical protein n=1 Tax=Nocardioides dongkuii TaxID=2760089 RepID=UPI00187885C0|nr:hypothetical protein [Nocardioides dongkuii]
MPTDDTPAATRKRRRWIPTLVVLASALLVSVPVASQAVDWRLHLAEWNGCTRASVETARSVQAAASRDVPERTASVELTTGKSCSTTGAPTVSTYSALEPTEALTVLAQTWTCSEDAVHVYERGDEVTCSVAGHEVTVNLYSEVDVEDSRRTNVVLGVQP